MRSFRLVSILILAAAACGGGNGTEPLFPERPECDGESIVPLAGQHAMVISFLEVGALEDGFDLDKDGEPDNQLAGIGGLARGAIEDAFESFDIVIPLEFFDAGDQVAADECVKFAIYLGSYKLDEDGDGSDTATDGGDCNDQDGAIGPGVAEVPDNLKDDDCDGLADETDVETDGGIMTVPSDNTDDADEDGVTIADGDCDDTNAAVLGPDAAEVCGDGLDNDCDGVADFGDDGAGNPACSPFDDTPDLLGLDPLGFDSSGRPIIAFTAGSVLDAGGRFELEAGPSIFSVSIPIQGDISLQLQITGASIVGELVMTPGGWAIRNGRLGGVIDAHTSDQISGLDVEEIGLSPEDTFLDATYANILGTIIGLPKVVVDGVECQTPDIDVDGDGLEAFCDTNPTDDVAQVDMCVDGNGEVILDEVDGNGEVTRHCTEATDADGNLRFRDGISVEINFETVPAVLPDALPPLP
jgi:hypothetical protein